MCELEKLLDSLSRVVIVLSVVFWTLAFVL